MKRLLAIYRSMKNFSLTKEKTDSIPADIGQRTDEKALKGYSSSKHVWSRCMKNISSDHLIMEKK